MSNDTCANCGKEGSNLNTCNKCKVVQYCNAACKKKHRSKHKKKCDRHVAEIHDEALFKQPPPAEDCPICFLRVPALPTGNRYMSCCGKLICNGCIHAPVYDNMGNTVEKKCPFCRTPLSDENIIDQLKKRAKVDEMGDVEAIYNLGCCYSKGKFGLPQDRDKAIELWHQAGELGNALAYYNIGNAYVHGDGVERDVKKARYYYELAAMGGVATSRYNLGVFEKRAGNYGRALKHFMIAVEGGYDGSLKMIQQMYSNGYATRDDYAKGLQAYQTYLSEVKSDDRDKAAAFDDEYKYYE